MIVADHGVVNMVAVVVGVAEACSHTWKTCLCARALLETHTHTFAYFVQHNHVLVGSTACCFDCSIARLVDGLVGRLAGWLGACWLIDWLVDF